MEWRVINFLDDDPGVHMKTADQKVAEFANQHGLQPGNFKISSAMEKADGKTEICVLYYGCTDLS